MGKTAKMSYPTVGQIESELERVRYKGHYGRTLRSTVYILIVVAAVAVLLATLFFPVFRIYGNSMSPTVNEGEIVVALKGSKFELSDVVVLSYNNKLLVKRVIAGPGEWVDIDLDGNVYVNGEMIDEPYIQEKAFGDCTLNLPYQVPDDRYFVLGDNRPTSQDSRNSIVGCVPTEQIVGRAVFRVWPLNQISALNPKNLETQE